MNSSLQATTNGDMEKALLRACLTCVVRAKAAFLHSRSQRPACLLRNLIMCLQAAPEDAGYKQRHCPGRRLAPGDRQQSHCFFHNGGGEQESVAVQAIY
jgi:hypothetical protein